MIAAFCHSTALLAIGCLLTLASPAFSQRRPTVPWQGSEFFRNLLHSFPYRCEPLQDIADLDRFEPAQTLIIVFGDNHVLDKVQERTGGLTRFHQRGGSMFIATDRNDEGRLRELKVRVSGLAVIAQKGSHAYQREQFCPLVTDFTTGEGEHPLVAGLRKGLATNLPSYLEWHRDCELEILANFPSDALVLDRWRPLVPLPYMMASSAAAGEKGRILIVAGHGVFQNQMMLNHDNYAFALNSIHWMTEGGKRKHVLFVEESKVQASFQVPLTKLPPPPLPRAEILDRLLHGLEQENLFNRLLLESIGARHIWRAVLLGLTVLVVVLAFRRLLVARHRPEPRLPLVAQKAALALAAPPVQALRREALLKAGNLWETARELARECFEVYGMPGLGSAEPPAFAVEGGWWQRWRLSRLVRRLWDLAYGPDASRISPRQIRRVQEDLAQLGLVLEAGLVVFS